MKDSTATLFRSATHFFSGTMLSRITGLGRDVSMALVFGTTPETAALLVAYRLANFFRRVFGEGALQSSFIPLFEELKAKDPNQAYTFFYGLRHKLTLLLMGLVVLAMTGLWFLSSPGVLSPNSQEISWLTFLMMPSLLFICLYGLQASLLQCEKNYFIPASAPVFFNLIWILGVLGLKGIPQDSAMRILALVINLACLGQLLATVPSIWRAIPNFAPSKILFPIKPLISRMSLGIVGIAATQINSAIDPLFARYADLEGPAYLWYAIRIYQYPLALFGLSLSAALLPPLCRSAKAANWEVFSSFLAYALAKSAGLMIPLSCLICMASEPIVAFLYGYGAFTSTSIAATATCLTSYAIGLYPATLVLVQAPAFFAKGDYRTPAIGSLISVGTNLILNSLLIFRWGFGAESVALATSFSALCQALFLMKKIRGYSATPFLRIAKVSIASLFAMGATEWLKPLLTFPPLPPFFAAFLALGCYSALFLSLLGIAGWLLKANDLLFWKAEAVIHED